MPTTLESLATVPRITHRQWAIFRAIMLHGNLSRAAEASNSSQPTLSRELARLEQLVGFSLFDRVRGRLRPTARAMALMQEVERSFVGLEHLSARVQELRLQNTVRLRIACLPALANAFLPRVLVQLAETHPEMAISVHPLESPWLEQALSEQRFDAGLSETSDAPVGSVLIPLIKVNEVAVLPVGHRLSNKKVLQPADFANERFISLSASDPYRQAIDQMFARAQVSRRTLVETTSAVAVCAMVRQGLGIAVINPLTALELAGTGLVVRPLSISITFQVGLLLPNAMAENPIRSTLLEAMALTAKELVQELETATAT